MRPTKQAGAFGPRLLGFGLGLGPGPINWAGCRAPPPPEGWLHPRGLVTSPIQRRPVDILADSVRMVYAP